MTQKGFTLIELLVVVAIIGVLAAVGVVAFNGYVNSAKSNVAKSNHASIVKYINVELRKCDFEEKIFEGHFNCVDKTNPSTMANSISIVVTKYIWGQGTSNPVFRHPEGYSAVSGRITPFAMVNCDPAIDDVDYAGNTLIDNTETEVRIVTCPDSQHVNRLMTKIQIDK